MVPGQEGVAGWRLLPDRVRRRGKGAGEPAARAAAVVGSLPRKPEAGGWALHPAAVLGRLGLSSPEGRWPACLSLDLQAPLTQDLEDLEEAEEPDLEEDDDQKAVKDEL